MRLSTLLPDVDAAMQLETDELAAIVMVYFNGLADHESTAKQNLRISEHNFFNDMGREKGIVDGPLRDRLMEAFSWLRSQNLLVPDASQHGNWYLISEAGKKITSSQHIEGIRKARMLQRGLLHPRIAEVSFPEFIRADYATAVFKAMREIEIAVRSFGNFRPSDTGYKLMGAAFKVPDGPLTDKTLPPDEQERMRDLFCGAVPLFKNPHSHRHSPIEAVDAAEAIGFASLLMKMVERLKP